MRPHARGAVVPLPLDADQRAGDEREQCACRDDRTGKRMDINGRHA
jgi:hypothetical protein